MEYSNSSGSRFWQRIGQPNALGMPFLIFSMAYVALLSFTFDAVRLDRFTWLWIPANLIAIAIVLTFAIPAVYIKHRINRDGSQQPIYNIAFATFTFGTKNALMLYISPLVGIVEQGNLGIRFLGGVALGFAALVIFTNIASSTAELRSSLTQLYETEARLLAYREVAIEHLENESELASERASATLSPQLKELRNSARESEDVVALSNSLSSFVENELRPFSAKLAGDAVALTLESASVDYENQKEPSAPVSMFEAIRVGVFFIPVPIAYYLSAMYVIPKATLTDILIASLISALVVGVFKISFLKLPKVKPAYAQIISIGVALCAGLPSYYLLYQIPLQGAIVELLPVFYIIPGWSLLASAQSFILDAQLSAIESKLNAVVSELARENKLYEQKAWLAQHGWYLLLHGVVQPAVTSASIRAANTQVISDSVRAQIISDLERAYESLKQPLTNATPLEESISEIRSVWKDVCNIDLTLDESVRPEVLESETFRLVINELLKEVVSNAVRHGNAKNVQIEISMSKEMNIEVKASNDGNKPLPPVQGSVGSRMMEALCLENSLSWNSSKERTEFAAVFPVSL